MQQEHRKGLSYSALLHLLILFLMIFGLPSFMQPETPPQPVVIAVDILPISEVTNAKPSDQPLSKEEKPEPKKEEKMPTPPVKSETPPPPPEPTPEPKPEPLPDPKKEEVKKEEKKPEPKPEPKKEEKPKKAKEEDLAAVLKSLKQEADKKKQEEADKQKKPPTESGTKVKAENTNYDASQPMSMSELDAIRSQIARCWSFNAGAKNADALKVTLHVQLAQDGTVLQVELADESKSRYASDSFYRSAAESAMRAVRLCSPLKNLPPDKFQTWHDMLMTFDPKEFF